MNWAIRCCWVVRDWMGHRAEIHRWLHSIVAYRLDGSVDDNQPWTVGIAMKALPVGTAYSVWVGVGLSAP